MPGNPFDALGGMMSGLQQNLADMAAQSDQTEVEGKAGGGLVRVRMTGNMDVKAITIDPKAMGDREMLEDLLVAATNDAVVRAREVASQRAMQMMSGLGLPPGLLDGMLPK